jgi:hypothetical protein
MRKLVRKKGKKTKKMFRHAHHEEGDQKWRRSSSNVAFHPHNGKTDRKPKMLTNKRTIGVTELKKEIRRQPL